MHNILDNIQSLTYFPFLHLSFSRYFTYLSYFILIRIKFNQPHVHIHHHNHSFPSNHNHEFLYFKGFNHLLFVLLISLVCPQVSQTEPTTIIDPQPLGRNTTDSNHNNQLPCMDFKLWISKCLATPRSLAQGERRDCVQTSNHSFLF